LPGNDGKSETEFITSLKGATGADGIGGKTIAGTGISITGSGTATDEYVVSAILPQQIIDEDTVRTDGQVDFTLTQTPYLVSKVRMYINGVRIAKDAITVTGTTVKYIPANNGSYALKIDDAITFDYLK
ncbi:hypothetical protein, partial [Flavobacterium phragmitis]